MPNGFIFKKPVLIMFFSYLVFSSIFINLPWARAILFYADQPGKYPVTAMILPVFS
jgi:hypothetical protein